MNYDIIGTLYTGGEYDEEGNVITAPVALEGFNVNTTTKLVGLDNYLVTPNTPRQVFAGVTTYFYTFPNEAFWLALGTDVEDMGWSLNPEYIPLDDQPTPNPVSSTGVPLVVTKRQGRQQLILMGILDNVQAAIDAIPDATQRLLVQSFWDDSIQYERYHPQMLQLAQAVGLTDEQLDQAFTAASQL